jgi:hypothetical protein
MFGELRSSAGQSFVVERKLIENVSLRFQLNWTAKLSIWSCSRENFAQLCTRAQCDAKEKFARSSSKLSNEA